MFRCFSRALLVICLASGLSLASVDGPGFAPVGLRADFDAARFLASDGQFTPAMALIKASLDGSSRELQESELGLLAARSNLRINELLELRTIHFASLAESGGKLRIEVDGKRRSVRVLSFIDGQIVFAKNKYGLESVNQTEVSFSDLANNWKTSKAGSTEQRCFALRLAGEKSWQSIWPKDEPGHDQLVSDLADMPESLLSGSHTLDLRGLEAYMGKQLTPEAGADVLARHQRLFQDSGPDFGEGGQPKYLLLRDLVRSALIANWGIEELAGSLHATTVEIIGDELRLVYEFDSEDELKDWGRDDLRMPELKRSGVPEVPEADWFERVEGGFWNFLGTHAKRHMLPFRGPLKVRYPMQVMKMHKENALFACSAFLQDDEDESYFSVLGFGHELHSHDRGRPKRLSRDRIYYFLTTNYYVNLVYDKAGLMTVFREDEPEKTLLSLKAKRLNHGHISIGVNTDYPMGYDSFEIQGTPDWRSLDPFRDEWVSERMATMGY